MACVIYKHDVLALAPQLTELPEPAWVMILAFVNAFTFNCDPTLRKLALCSLAAHFGVLNYNASMSSATTAVVSESAGGLKRTYAQPIATSTAAADFDRTDFGKQFMAIANMSSTTRGPRLI